MDILEEIRKRDEEHTGLTLIVHEDRRWLLGEVERLRVALEVILNQIDYTAGRCRQTEMIGALITKQEFQIARRALAGEE